MSDHIELAKGLTSHPEFASAHALIAIAEELRRMNEYTKPKQINVNNVNPIAQAARAMHQDDFQSNVYPFGRQP